MVLLICKFFLVLLASGWQGDVVGMVQDLLIWSHPWGAGLIVLAVLYAIHYGEWFVRREWRKRKAKIKIGVDSP